MIVAEKYKHRPHPLEVVEVTLENYLEVGTYIGAEIVRLSVIKGDADYVEYADIRNGMSIRVKIGGKISIDHEKQVLPLNEEFIKTNYKKA